MALTSDNARSVTDAAMGVAQVGHFHATLERLAVLLNAIVLDDVLLSGNGLNLALAEVGTNAVTFQTGQHPAVDNRLKNQNLCASTDVTDADRPLAHHVIGDFGLLNNVRHIVPLSAFRLSVVVCFVPLGTSLLYTIQGTLSILF